MNISNQSVNLPDILIFGAAKSGTTSLAFFLKQHPGVVMPVKEPGFFAYYGRPTSEIPSGIREYQITDFDAYTSMYGKAGKDKMICDASVSQFSNHRHTLANIEKLYGDRKQELKTMVILRHPADRAFSHYLMFLKNGLEHLPFEDAIQPEVVESRIHQQLGFDYLGGSMYAERLAAFKEVFPDMKVYFTEELKNTRGVLDDFLEYCGLSTDVDIDTSVKLNPSGIPKKKGLIKLLHKRSKLKRLMKRYLPDKMQYKLIAVKSGLLEKSIERVSIDPKLKADLTRRHFAEDIRKTEALTGRDLSHWYAGTPEKTL